MKKSSMVLADLGVAAVIFFCFIITGSVIARQWYRRLHPPPSTEEVTARLESELTEINKEIGNQEGRT